MSGHDDNEHVRDTGPMKLMETEMQIASEQHKANQMSSPIEDIMELVMLSGAAKEVWNAAIEAAAMHCDEMGEEARISENIRGLKK